MFVKLQDPSYASAININKFDVITVRRDGDTYKLSAYNVPLENNSSYHDIASFASSQVAIEALGSLMKAIAEKEPFWSLD